MTAVTITHTASIDEIATEMDRRGRVIEQMEAREVDLVAALKDICRICEAVRYTAGLGRHQWERVEKARALAGGRP